MRYEIDRTRLPDLAGEIVCGSCNRQAFLFFVTVGEHKFPTFHCSQHGDIHPVRVPSMGASANVA